jgi:ribosome-binding factor A
MSDGRRPARVAETIREYLAVALGRELSDPRFLALTITRVEVPPDLSSARVYVRLFIGDDERARKSAVRMAQNAVGRLRRGLGPVLGVKRVPELRFEYDTWPDASQRIEEILQEIKSDGDEPKS